MRSRDVIACALAFCGVHAGAVAQGDRLVGYTQAQMTRGPQNHLVLGVTVNGHAARLLVDTGATITFLRKDRARELGVRELKETTRRGGSTFPLASVDSLQVGGVALRDAQVALADSGHFRGTLRGGGAADGVLGLDLLRRQKAVINCRTRQIFFKTDPQARLNLVETTRGMGFARISLEESRGGDLLVACTLRGRRGRLVLDTGAFVTGIDDDVARTLGLTTEASRLKTRGFDGRVRPLELAQIDDLRIGGVPIAPQLLAVTDLFGEKKRLRTYTGLGRIEYYDPRKRAAAIFGVLGNELLDQRRAIIDLENMVLYLK